jgi:hypothetical protein
MEDAESNYIQDTPIEGDKLGNAAISVVVNKQ